MQSGGTNVPVTMKSDTVLPMNPLEQLLTEADLSVRAMSGEQVASIVMAMLLLSDEGILITDLNHKSLACNSGFGQIFGVRPTEVTRMEVEELRGYVYPRLHDPIAWKDQLDRIYAQPDLTHEDEMELSDSSGSVWIRRRTSPLYRSDRSIIGRLWSFRDITQSKLRERRREALTRVSHFFDPDPNVVCKMIVRELSEFYQSAAVLSIWEGDRMIFRETCAMPPGTEHIRENMVKDAFCQAPLKTCRPVLFQDAREHELVKNIPVVAMGITRCLPAPLLDSNGAPIGTLCFLDSKSNHILNAEDEEFVALLAQRVSVELERERLFEERTAAQRAEIERQRTELATTETVFHAMNSAFQLLSQNCTLDQLVAHQTTLLHGLLGYRSVSLMRLRSGKLQGFATKPNQPRARTFSTELGANTALQIAFDGARNQVCQVDLGATPLEKAMACRYASVARIPLDSADPYILVFGAKHPSHWDSHHEAHVTALIDQVALLITAHQLQADLQMTLDDLRNTQELLVQSEKLSVVGTLAASVSHDIRNIVASLTLECSLPIDNVETFRQRVKAQVERFSLLANRLLAYAKPQKFAQELTDVREVVLRASDMLSAQAKMWRSELRHSFDDEVPLVEVDQGRLEHVFVNLILNAMQAFNSSGGIIDLEVRHRHDNVSILVRDNGRGIAPEQRADLFRPFRSSRSDGFGLGLYSCQQILNDHGWTINVRSEVNVGTEFEIIAPLPNRAD